MTGFKYLRSVRKSPEEQGLIYYSCACYATIGRRTRRKIDRLIESAGGDYAPALRDYLTTGASWVSVCDRHHISGATLDRVRRKFYNAW